MRTMKVLLVITLLSSSAFAAAEKKLEVQPVPMNPPETSDALLIEALKAENELLKAQLVWAQQELEIWNNIGVIRVRLAMHEARLKAEQLKQKQQNKGK